MNPTKTERSFEVAGALFDEVLAPLAKSRRGAGAPPYFPLREDPKVTSYFVAPPVRSMTPADFELPLGDKSEALIDGLSAFWKAHGDPELTALAPGLKQLAHALSEEAAESDGKVDILCYTLF